MTEELNRVTRSKGFGDFTSSSFDFMRGINRHSNGGLNVAPNKDLNAFVFFTRPTMNMLTENLSRNRKMLFLLNEEQESIGNAIRTTLMPRQYVPKGQEFKRSKLIDDNNPFIPMLSNSLVNVSNWPVKQTDFFISNSGIAQEEYGHVDGRPDIYNRNDLSVTFDNREGNPVGALITAWNNYQLSISCKKMVMLPEFYAKRRLDYQLRAYVLVTDPTKKFITNIACTGVSMWGSDNEGSTFNWTRETPFVEETDDISVPLTSFGAWYNDPIIIHQFNKLVRIFAASGNSEKEFLEAHVKLSDDEVDLFNFIAVPYLNDRDNVTKAVEIEWYVTKSKYIQIREHYGL